MEIPQIAAKLRSKNYAVTRLQDESGVLLNEADLLVFTLNDTGLFLLEAIEEGTAITEDALVELLTREFEVSDDDARHDIRHFLEDLSEALGPR